MLNPRNLANGQEQYETFKSNITRETAVQYDYLYTRGSCNSKAGTAACGHGRNPKMMNKSKIEYCDFLP